ncbi:MAG: tRNA pseudouridine(55) synthase TruB, partial [Eubacteriales bacterium]|nr:tRNA pseudouridine(55) synthase TruB [Eubacteriales bacterium]
VNGQRLYDLARKGIEVERKARTITVHEAELLAFDEASQRGEIRFVCSKGTYVRTLIHDLGEALGTYAVMTALQRTRSGRYMLEQSYTLEQVQAAAEADDIASLLLQTDSLFLQYPAVSIDDYGYKRAQNGAFITPEHVTDMPQEAGALCRVYYNGVFWMLGRVNTLDRGGLALFYEKRFR